MAKRILVTGGAGFIGSWFVHYLLESYPDYQVTNLDLLTYAGNLENLQDIEKNPNYQFVRGDIRDPALVERLMSETDVCVNIAAQTHVDRSISGPSIFVSTNVLGTQTLLEAARKANIEKFVQVSTDEVYGSLQPHDPPFSETTPLDPSSPYSASKAGGDLLVMSYYTTYGLPINITRCSNNYGPNQYPEKMIPLFILNLANDEPVPVYGNGQNIRDWIHVKDHNRAVDLVLHQGKPGEIYNIGADNEQVNLTLTKKIIGLMDKPESLIEFVTDRLGHDLRYAINSHKIQSTLDWRPMIDFNQGLRETIDWYLQNSQWVEFIQARQREEAALGTR